MQPRVAFTGSLLKQNAHHAKQLQDVVCKASDMKSQSADGLPWQCAAPFQVQLQEMVEAHFDCLEAAKRRVLHTKPVAFVATHRDESYGDSLDICLQSLLDASNVETPTRLKFVGLPVFGCIPIYTNQLV